MRLVWMWPVLLVLCSLTVVAQEKYPNAYQVQLRSMLLEPLENRQEQLNRGDLHDEAHALSLSHSFKHLQFYQTPTAAQRQKLEDLGIQFLSYLPHKVYLVAIPVTLDAQQLELPEIRSIFDLPALAKASPDINERPAHATDGPYVNVTVLYPEMLPEATVRTLATNAAEGAIRFDAATDGAHALNVWVREDHIADLLTAPWSMYVELAPAPGEPESELGRSTHRTSMIDTEYATGRHYDGTGVSLAINDDGFVGPHIDFTGRADQSEVANDFAGTHGDMTTGIAGGAGNLNPIMRGMATGAFLHVRPYNSNLPNTVNLHNSADVMIFSSSFGDGCNAGYTNTSRLVDEEIHNNPPLIQVFSTGNSGTSDCGYGPPGWGNITGGHKVGKNVISVANLFDNDAIAGSSSKGPAQDGRLKPDIAAHGQGQFSTDPNNTYVAGGGTSAAAPGIAGVLAQLFQAYREMNNGNDPESALLKACLLNSAEDLGNPGPDFRFGWGRVNAFRALTTLEDQRYLDATIDQGSMNTHQISIPSGVREAKIMLYWADPEANPSALTALVNDLDLRVEDNTNTMHLPLVLNPTPIADSLSAPAVPGNDNLNNMEQVTLIDPAAGTYTVEISGSNVPEGPQDYYIVYQFITEEITLTYPNGGESFVPGVDERIRWDAYQDLSLGNFTLEYSTDDGNNWTQVNSLAGDLREMNWTVPVAVTGEAQFRITRGNESDETDANFTIVGQPQNLQVPWTCPDSIQLTWDAVPGATSYEVSKLGSMYMDPVTTVNDNFAVLYGLNPLETDWLSVKALGPNGMEGRRAIAIQKPILFNNCTLPTDVVLTQVNNPADGTISGCFDLSSTNFKVTLTNAGTVPIEDIPVNYILNGSNVVTEIVPGPIDPGNDLVYTFTASENLNTPQSNSIAVWTSLGSDPNPYNDTIRYDMLKTDESVSVTTPYTQDFETFPFCAPNTACEFITCNFPAASGWINETNNAYDQIDWRTDASGTTSPETGPSFDHNPGTAIGRYLYTEASECFGREARMLTPCIDLTTGKWPEFVFWYHMFGATMGDLHVDVLTQEGYDLDVVVIQGNQMDQWNEQKISLHAYSGQVIALRFRGLTGPDFESDMAIDDIFVWDALGTSTEESIIDQPVSLYPNPTNANSTLSLNLGDATGTVSLRDGLGRELRSYRLTNGPNLVELDLQALPAGVYTVIARTDSGQLLATEKLVRQ